MRNDRVRPIGWIQAARKAYRSFPLPVRDRINTALTIAARGSKADIAKPLKGLGSGVMEVAVRYRTDAWRVVYAAEIAGSLWVIHAFQEEVEDGNSNTKVRNRPRQGSVGSTEKGFGTMNERGEFQLVEGSGNVFRDFEDPDADLKQAKAVLAGRVIAALDERGLGVRKAAGLTGFAAADFSRIRNANLGRFTLDRLLRMLAALDGRAEITLQVREPRPRRPIIVDKSYAQGAASLQVLHKDWDLVFPDAFFFEVTSTSAQARSRCLRKLRDIHRHGALHVAPNVGELLRREILGLNHAGAPSDNLIHGLPLDDFFGLSFEDLAQARRSALQQTEVQFSRDVDGLVAKANMLLGRFRGTSEGTTQERKKAYGIARNTIAHNRDFISAFFADFVCQGRHLEPAAPILAAIARSNGIWPSVDYLPMGAGSASVRP